MRTIDIPLSLQGSPEEELMDRQMRSKIDIGGESESKQQCPNMIDEPGETIKISRPPSRKVRGNLKSSRD